MWFSGQRFSTIVVILDSFQVSLLAYKPVFAHRPLGPVFFQLKVIAPPDP
jgi:hypothetical protein